MITLISELKRLREIEHLAWHVCESSSEDVKARTITVDLDDFNALVAMLSEEHPQYGELPK